MTMKLCKLLYISISLLLLITSYYPASVQGFVRVAADEEFDDDDDNYDDDNDNCDNNNNITHDDEVELVAEKQQQQQLEVEFRNNNPSRVQVYYMDARTEEQSLVTEVEGYAANKVQSTPGHIFIVTSMDGIERGTFFVSADPGIDKMQTFVIQNFETKVQVIFVNNYYYPNNNNDNDNKLLEIFWLNEETKEGHTIGKVALNRRFRVDTKTGHKFAVYNEDRSFRMDYTVTAQRGQTQFFIIQNKVKLSFYNAGTTEIALVHSTSSVIIDNSEEEQGHSSSSITIYENTIGYINSGETLSIYTEEKESQQQHNSKYVAYDATDGETKIDEFVVTAKNGESQSFEIGSSSSQQ